MNAFIYHEKQVASLCGQHCLNNLLQGPYFTSFNLADIANELDTQERALRVGDTTAFESVNAALVLKEGYADALAHRAELYASKGELEKAIIDYETAIQIEGLN